MRITDDAHVVIDGVPYLTEAGNIERASLVMPLALEGGRAAKPPDHVAYWTGGLPRFTMGKSLEEKAGGTGTCEIVSVGNVRMLSARADYSDYRHKAVTYVELITAAAREVKPSVSARRRCPTDA